MGKFLYYLQYHWIVYQFLFVISKFWLSISQKGFYCFPYNCLSWMLSTWAKGSQFSLPPMEHDNPTLLQNRDWYSLPPWHEFFKANLKIFSNINTGSFKSCTLYFIISIFCCYEMLSFILDAKWCTFLPALVHKIFFRNL